MEVQHGSPLSRCGGGGQALEAVGVLHDNQPNRVPTMLRNQAPYTKSRWLEPMCPASQAEGHDAPGLINELVPGVAAVVGQVLVGGEDAV